MPFLRRVFGSSPEITICIPTYNAAPFIARTLFYATGQTHRNIRILVSVDQSEDDTAEICRTAAATDPRIEVFTDQDRVGWAGNSAALLNRVETPYFFFYFHDDFIAPQYCARLLQVLQTSPAAASANCTLDLIGRKQASVPAHAYDGEVWERLLTMLTHDQIPGAPLRSLIRTDRFEGADLLRPGTRPGELFQAFGLHTAILSAGPSVALRENLYTRWLRDDALTTQATPPGQADLIRVWSETLTRLWPFLERHIAGSEWLALVRHTFLLRALRVILRAPDISPAALDSLWEAAPFLPPATPAPPAPDLPPALTDGLRSMRAQIFRRLDRIRGS
jgi:hypothetical protein